MIPFGTAEAQVSHYPMVFNVLADGSVYAEGLIGPDTPDRFREAAFQYDFRGRRLILNSPGGRVDAGIVLGRLVRENKMKTTVGSVLAGAYVPRGECDSMCPFVLLAGVERVVPNTCRVALHQIKVGNKTDKDDYSPYEVVSLMRDAGKLAAYAIDMGGSARLIDLMFQQDPYGKLLVVSPKDLRRTRLVTKK